MELGATLLEARGASRGVLLTTDADARPGPFWIAGSLEAIAAGADVAAARLVGRPAEEARFPPALQLAAARVGRVRDLAVRLEDAIDPVPGDPPPRHGDHCGAGLAVTRAAYRAAGGCPAAPIREDRALVAAIRRAGGLVRHCPRLAVEVSARLHGRAAGGMAETVRGWSGAIECGAAILVPDPRAMVAHWRGRAAVRAEATRTCAAAPAEAARRIAAAVARRAPDPLDWPASVPAAEATALLERRLAALEARDAVA